MLFPEKTQLNKILPKAKLMQLAQLSTIARNEINANVDRIIISNVLREDTINTEKGTNVKEIDVFKIIVKEKRLSDNLIKELDTAIQMNILYALEYKDEFQFVISYKEKSTTGKNKVLKTYRTQWKPLNEFKFDIKGLNLDAVFTGFIEQISEGKVEITDNTSLKGAVEKSIDKEKLEKKIAQLENKIKKEVQFNKQLELKKELQLLKKELNKFE